MIEQNLYITHSNQKAREIKQILAKPLDKVITLNGLVQELFEKHSFKRTMDPIIATSFLFHTIKNENILYLDFIFQNSDTLDLIYDFILKVNASDINFEDILAGEKLQAIKLLDKKYQEFKKVHNLFDHNDLIDFAIENLERYNFDTFKKIYLDSFENTTIKFYKSNLELKLIEMLRIRSQVIINLESIPKDAKLHKLAKQPFDVNDEVQSALKLSRKLLEDYDELKSNDICIVTTDISEYAPIFRLYLDKYDLKGYDSKGLSLNLFNGKKSLNSQIQNAFNEIDMQLKSIKRNCAKYNLSIDFDKLKEKLTKQTYIIQDKVGIELTEANQLAGLNKSFEHIIFIGADINHFPPKKSDNFLYSSDIGQKYFCENGFYESSLYQYEELKRIAKNLYVIYPQYKEKRELAPSIIIDQNIKNKIDISSIQTVQKRIDQEDYIESITSNEFTKYDGLEVDEVKALHLSASQLGSYAKCPLKYLYTYKLKVKTPREDEDGFDPAQQGTIMHACFEEFAKKVQGNTSLERNDFKSIMLETLNEEYQKFLDDPKNEIIEENIFHKLFHYTLSKGLNDDNEDGLLIKFILAYDQNKEELNYFKTSEFEKEFALDSDLKPYTLENEDDRDYFIKGYIDRFDKLDDQINIIDYKSKKASGVSQEKLDEIREFKDFQLGLYILYAKQEYKKEIDSYLLTYKSDKSLSTKFARISTDEENIPQYRGKDTGVHYNEKYESDLISNIYEIKERIENGKFYFDNSNEDYCGYCEIKNMCNASVLNKGEIVGQSKCFS